jgi:hypothetical protein
MTQSFDDRRKEFEKAITPKVWEVVRQTEEATKRRIWESIQRFQINASDAGAVFKREDVYRVIFENTKSDFTI